MIVLGLVLLVLAVLFGAAVVIGNVQMAVGVAVFPGRVEMTVGAVFLAGAVTLLVVMVALALLRRGVRRARRRRAEVRALRSAAVDSSEASSRSVGTETATPPFGDPRSPERNTVLGADAASASATGRDAGPSQARQPGADQTSQPAGPPGG